MTMQRPGVVALLCVSFSMMACNSSSSSDGGGGMDGGPDGGGGSCASSPSQNVPCQVTLTGDVNLSFPCTTPYGTQTLVDGGTVTSLVQIGAQNIPNPADPDAGVKSLDITLAFYGDPTVGAANLVPASPSAKPNSIILILNDALSTTFNTYYASDGGTPDPDAGQMSLTISAFDSDVAEQTLWCVHGTVTAAVPDLYNPARVINLKTTF